jgi:ATP-dependent Lhr-like helicase
MSEISKAIDAWFAARGWTVFPFQHAVWKAALAGQSGLLHATTGAGKTYAVWFAALLHGHRQGVRRQSGLRVCGSRRSGGRSGSCGPYRPVS